MSAVADMEVMHMLAACSRDEDLLQRAQTHGVKIRYIVGLSTPRSTESAWRENAACVQCTRPVETPRHAALVITRDKARRVAHRGDCFFFACLATNPAIRAGESLDHAVVVDLLTTSSNP